LWLHSVIFLLINILEISGKSLFFKIFRSSPNKLWITLLKTQSDASETLEKQGFPWIARELSKFIKIN